MFERSLLTRPAVLGLFAATLSFPAVLSAQAVVVAGTMSNSVAMIGSGLPIADDAARSMIERNLSDVFATDTDRNHVILVVDATGQYVNGKSIKATVIHRVAGEEGQPSMVTVHDSAGAAAGVVVTRFERTGPTVVAEGGAGGAGAAVMISRSATAASAGAAGAGMMGMGIAPADIETIGTKTIPAGQWRAEALTVTVIKLK